MGGLGWTPPPRERVKGEEREGEGGSKRKEKKDGRGKFGNKKVSRDMGDRGMSR